LRKTVVVRDVDRRPLCSCRSDSFSRSYEVYLFFQRKRLFLRQCSSAFGINDVFFSFLGRRLEYDNFRWKLVREVAGAGKTSRRTESVLEMLKSGRGGTKTGNEGRDVLARAIVPAYILVSCRHASKQMTSRAREVASLSHLDTNLFFSLVSIIILPPSPRLLVCGLLDLTRQQSLLPDALKLFRLVLIRFGSGLVIILKTSSWCTGGLARDAWLSTQQN
jgi:hypothetical protein